MDYETTKAFILSFWTRYLASWVLKALTGFLAAHGVASESAGNQATAIVSGLLALLTFALDFWHSRATTTANINTLPPKDIVSKQNNDDGTTTTVAAQTKPTEAAK